VRLVIIRAIKTVIIKAAVEMTSSNAKVVVTHLRHAACAKAPDAGYAKATDMTSTKAADVASAKATHVASAKATVSSSAASSGLCIRGNEAAGKQCACQNHHYTCSHHILHISV
jgi:hypothetical protein